MRYFTKNKVGAVAAMLSIISLASFLVFYIPNYVIPSEPVWLFYFRIYFGEAASFVVAPLAVTLILYRLTRGGKFTALILPAVALSATRCIIHLPYYYLLETAVGNDWIESTTLSLGINLIILILDSSLILGLAYGAYKLCARLTKKMGADDSAYSLSGVLALSRPEYVALFSTTLVIFIINIITEALDVAEHLESYGTFRSSELIFVVSKFILLIALLAISYVLQALLYNSYRKADENDNRA